jgi:hypothetical protein
MESSIADPQVVEEEAAEQAGAPEPNARRRWPSALIIVGAAFVAGVVLAKTLAWKTDVDAGD